MPLVSITRLRVRSWRFMPIFLFHAMRTDAQAKKAPGNVAVSLLSEAHRTFWTVSVWDDEEAMRTYRGTDPHRRVMGRLARWCDEASVVHWTQSSRAAPSWDEAHARMQRDGRPSRVDRPTEAHLAYRIASIRSRRLRPSD